MGSLGTPLKSFVENKGQQVVLFSSIAIALYSYDQGMMSLNNTNRDYLRTVHISPTSPLVGVIVGAVIFSKLGDRLGRKKAILAAWPQQLWVI
jgi:MFS family permease